MTSGCWKQPRQQVSRSTCLRSNSLRRRSRASPPDGAGDAADRCRLPARVTLVTYGFLVIVMTQTRRRGVGTLPGDLTSFVGRRQAAADVKHALSVSRLVTLTGVGGVGKSRLALRVAHELRRAFPDGTW